MFIIILTSVRKNTARTCTPVVTVYVIFPVANFLLIVPSQSSGTKLSYVITVGTHKVRRTVTNRSDVFAFDAVSISFRLKYTNKQNAI